MAHHPSIDSDALISFAQRLVRCPSLSCQEASTAKLVEAEMHSLGFDRVETDPHGSVIGVLEGAEPGKTLLLDAHTDTVDVTGAVAWERDPFSGDVDDRFLHGRGSADMKGALAAMVHAAASVDRSAIRGRVVVSASPMEEVLEGVALEAVMEAYPPDFVIIGEASGLDLAVGGRGRAEIHLETRGIPTHSSAPHLGRNAVLDMMKVVAGIEEIELPEHDLMGPAILALTEIASAPYPANSVIPSICRATYDRRTILGETEEDVLGAIMDLPAAKGMDLTAKIGVGEYNTFTGTTLRKEKFFPAWAFPQDHWFVQRSLEGLALAGLHPATRAYRFCTNAAFSAGVAGIPTVGFGPAEEADAHRVNEKLSLQELEKAARGYRGIMDTVLGGGSQPVSG